MGDLVVTVPKTFWREWIAEGDAAGEPETGEEWAFHLGIKHRPPIEPGERLYIVAWNHLRGYAPVTRVVQTDHGWAICRMGGAVAMTLVWKTGHGDALRDIPGFRGFRHRWWKRNEEKSFPAWKTAGVN